MSTNSGISWFCLAPPSSICSNATMGCSCFTNTPFWESLGQLVSGDFSTFLPKVLIAGAKQPKTPLGAWCLSEEWTDKMKGRNGYLFSPHQHTNTPDFRSSGASCAGRLQLGTCNWARTLCCLRRDILLCKNVTKCFVDLSEDHESENVFQIQFVNFFIDWG